MCGIFGIIARPNSDYPPENMRETLETIAVFSESRGKDSSGMAIRKVDDQHIDVIKGDIPIRQLLKSEEFNKEIEQGIFEYRNKKAFSAFGYARLVTNGTQLNEVNKQPVS